MIFAEPHFLIIGGVFSALLLILFIGQYQHGWKKLSSFISRRMTSDLTRSFSKERYWTKQILLIGAIIFIFISLARPQKGVIWEESKREGIDILFAIDTSRSMLAEDIKPNRLARAKLAIMDFVQELKGDRIGIIAFAGKAFLQCPLTLDQDAFEQSLRTLDTKIIARQGTNIANAIAEAEAAFHNSKSHKILVLITDGEDLEAEGIRRARKAAENGLTIYTIGVGNPDGELIPVINDLGKREYLTDDQGNYVKTRLDEETLARIAQATHGIYAPLGAAGNGLQEVYTNGLSKLDKTEAESRLHRIPIERYQWPLAGSILFLLFESLISNRKRRIRSGHGIILLLSLIGISQPQDATAKNLAWEAQKLYDAGSYTESAHTYQEAIAETPEDRELSYNAGISFYRAAQYQQALECFRQAIQTEDVELQEKSYFNIANTLHAKGDAILDENQKKTRELWNEALREYQNALSLNPKNEKARYNHDLIEQKLNSLPLFDIDLQPSDPSRGSVTGSGTYDRGEKVTIEAKPEEGYLFNGWETEAESLKSKSEPKVSLNIKEDIRGQALFAKIYNLGINIYPSDAGSVEGNGEHPEATPIPIKATSNYGYRFVRWEGAGISQAESKETDIQLTQDTTITAVFEKAYEVEIITDEHE